MQNTEPLAAARELRSLIESEADAVDTACTMTPAVVDAIDKAGLFRLSTPRDLGGMEADVATIVDVCEELAYADGSVGWAFAQNITVGAYAAYLAPAYAEPLAQARAGAGMFAPLGAAHEQEGGYTVSGSYKFGSGSGHAQFMGGAALIMRDGEVAVMEDGALPVLGFIVPADRVELKRDWDVMGLRGTGSFDFDVPEQFVETGRTFSLFDARIVNGGPIYGLGPVPLGTISSCAWALGVAERALEEIAAVARGGRARMGQTALRDQQVFQRDFGLHKIGVQAARSLAKDSYGRAVETVAAGAPKDVCEDQIRETKAAANYIVRVAKEAVTFAWEVSGSVGIRNPSLLQRCFRDMYVGGAHMVFDDRNYNQLAMPSLGLVPDPF